MWPLLAQLDNFCARLKSIRRHGKGGVAKKPSVFDFKPFLDPAQPPRGRALVSFVAGSLPADAARGRSLWFNPNGASLEIVRALNELGFVVDMVSFNDTDFRPTRPYDVFIGHASYNFRQIVEALPAHVPRAYYSTGSYWRFFNSENAKRYDRFCERNGMKRESVETRREPLDQDYSLSITDLLICMGPETAKTFAPSGVKQIAEINNAAYLDANLSGLTRDYSRASKHFIYYGGAGNIVKGLDLLIEAFAAEPDCHLHLYTPLEEEMIQAYRRELSAPNIHYSFHLRFWPGRVRELLKSCAFSVQCGFTTGQTTSMIASMGYGLVPVMNRDASIQTPCVLIEDNTVAAIRSAIRQASQLPPDAIALLSNEVKKAFADNHTPDAFRNGIKKAVVGLLAGSTK